MKISKKILSVASCGLVMGASLVCLASCGGYQDFADGLTESKGLTIYHVSEKDEQGFDLKFVEGYVSTDDYYAVTGIGTCTDKRIVIPEFYDDGVHGKKPVAAIADWAQLGKNGATTLVAHNTLESIGQLGLMGGIKRVVANGVKCLGDGSCSGLGDDYVVAPQGLVHADQWAWFFTTGPKTIWLPKTLVEIGTAIFMDSSWEHIDYEGTAEDWSKITFAAGEWEYPEITFSYNVAFPADKISVDTFVA